MSGRFKHINFVIPGEPKGKPRPRACIRGNHASVYYDREANFQEEQIAKIARGAAENAGIHMIQDDLTGIKVTIIAIFPLPKRASKAEREYMLAGGIYPRKKPDIDNIAKLILDGINRAGIWTDDAEVTDLNVYKRYTKEEPEISVSIVWREV